MSKEKKERLAKLRRSLSKCRAQRQMDGGETDADYAFRKRVNAAVDLFIAWVDFELAEGE